MEIDFARRRAVMERSQKLGHCICNPKQSCPCPPLIERNVCPCAGERLPAKAGQVALTRHVRKAGCASKIGQADLLKILSALPPVRDPNVLVGTAAGDDAGVYRLDDRHALVQTVDVFTPCVDDPYLFGQIAAANSVSDVYAMGGRPITALSIVGFPIDELDGSIMEHMLRGGMDKLDEAGCALIGGHSINDDEIKCGFAVTGLIDRGRAIERDRARPGDVLVLTKPLGTGMIAFAAQLGLVSESGLAEAGAWMAALNKDAAELMVKHGASACTDITGYGLAGHLLAMGRGSGVDVEIDLSTTPVFATVSECIEKGVFGGAVDRNQAYAMGWICAADGSAARNLPVLFDAQTSGGLLISMPEQAARAFLVDMKGRGHNAAAIIGRVLDKPAGEAGGRITVINGEFQHFVGTPESLDLSKMRPVRTEAPPSTTAAGKDTACCETPQGVACCDMLPSVGDAATDRVHVIEKENGMDPFATFREFMKEANTPGRIDARNKKLIAVALSIASHCNPCLKTHLHEAIEMHIPKEELDEVAKLATEFGGCPAMMFYRQVCQELGLH